MNLGKMTKIFIPSALTVILSACSGGGNGSGSTPGTTSTTELEGTYYIPAEDLGGGEYTSEVILEIKKGSMTQISVHDGATIQMDYTLTVSEGKLSTSGSEEQSYNCNGGSVKMEAESALNGVEYKKTGDSLQVTVNGDTISMTIAKQEDIDRIKALPVCEKL